jgi:hypothetical protein
VCIFIEGEITEGAKSNSSEYLVRDASSSTCAPCNSAFCISSSI